MFCVHCGATEQSDHAYCKRCGKWLGSSPPDQRLLVTLIFSAVSAVFGAASAIALYSTYLGTNAGTPAVYLAATFCCVISVHQTISFFFQLELFRRLKRGRTDDHHSATAEIDRLPGPSTTRELKAADPAEFVPVPSVVEGTTELLEPVPRPVKQDHSR